MAHGVLACRRTGYPLPWVTHHYPGPALEPSRSEARRRHHVFLVVSLGIYLPCQVITADLRLACTSTYRS
jgi:hypothetical protein